MMQMILSQPGAIIPVMTLAVSAVMLLALAAVDIWREELSDTVSAAAILIALAGLLADGITPTQWTGALLTAVVIFGTYLLLGMRGAMGGGDVKLSPLPAVVLGAVSPVLAFLWLSATITLNLLLHLAAARPQPRTTGTVAIAIDLPHVPAMALTFAALLPLAAAL